MKVAWVHNFPPETMSSGVFMHIFAREVKKQGIDLTLIYTGPLARPDRLLRAPGRLAPLTKGYDLIHAQYGSSCGYVTSQLPGRKVLTLRGSDWYGDPPTSLAARLHGAACRWLTHAQIPRYDLVIVVSNRMKQAVSARWPHLSIETLPCGVDLAQFAPMDRMEARRRLGAPDDSSPWVLFSSVKDANPVKRAPLALQAFERLRKELPNAKLKVMTGRPHREVPLWVNGSDAVLLTSSHEGWPNIIKEAMACNVPFVSTDVSDLRAIADGEPSCHIAEPTPDDLARCLAATLRSPRPDSLRRHAETMDLVNTVKRLIACYHRLLDS